MPFSCPSKASVLCRRPPSHKLCLSVPLAVCGPFHGFETNMAACRPVGTWPGREVGAPEAHLGMAQQLHLNVLLVRLLFNGDQ